MKTEFVRRGIASYQDGPTLEYGWGFSCRVNGWPMSFHYPHTEEPLSEDDLPRDPSRVGIILIPRDRHWVSKGPFLRFRTLSSALAHAHAGVISLSFPAGHVYASVGILPSLRAFLHLRYTPPDFSLPCSAWSTKDHTAVSLARACMRPSPDCPAGRQAALLSDWLLEHGPAWLSVSR